MSAFVWILCAIFISRTEHLAPVLKTRQGILFCCPRGTSFYSLVMKSPDKRSSRCRLESGQALIIQGEKTEWFRSFTVWPLCRRRKVSPREKRGPKRSDGVRPAVSEFQASCLFPLVLRVYTRWHARKAEQIQKLACVFAEPFGPAAIGGRGVGAGCVD